MIGIYPEFFCTYDGALCKENVEVAFCKKICNGLNLKLDKFYGKWFSDKCYKGLIIFKNGKKYETEISLEEDKYNLGYYIWSCEFFKID